MELTHAEKDLLIEALEKIQDDDAAEFWSRSSIAKEVDRKNLIKKIEAIESVAPKT